MFNYSPDANIEQHRAIMAPGGVLLNAGAGSGKTFVIVGHLIQKLNEKYISIIDRGDDPENALPLEMEKFVVMTFTKKAAGELTLRIHKKIKSLIENYPNEPQWKIVFENIGRVYIGTIHGFCYRLIGNGHIPNVNPESDIIDQFTLENHLSLFIDDYLDNYAKTSHHVPKILRARKSIVTALTKIYSEPDLSLLWKNFNFNKSQDEILKDYFKMLGKLTGLNQLWDEEWSDQRVEIDKKAAAWQATTNNSLDAIQGQEFNIEGVEALFNVVQSVRFVQPKGKDERFYHFFGLLKELKEFAKDNLEDLKVFYSDFDSFKKWMQTIKSLYDYLQKNYQNLGVLTFGDIELATHAGLLNPSVKAQVNKLFDYFIVDEFQDTSWMQYEILTNAVNGDLNKVFCVGDMKQAIYGFRGGEIGVFKDFQSKVPYPLQLKANYRSKANVVDFNNRLFRNVLALGLEYEGEDKHAVEVVDQEWFDKENGELLQLYVEIESDKSKYSSSDLNKLEAQIISDYLNENKETLTCVLYRQLKPSHDLIVQLMTKNIGFRCQVKVPFSEDPVIVLFSSIIESLILLKTEEAKFDLYLEFLVTNIFKILNIKSQDTKLKISKLLNHVKLYGLKIAFDLFLLEIGLVQTQLKDSKKFIDSLCSIYSDDFESIYEELKMKLSSNYNFEFTYGPRPQNVIIMTAHASKGLQFPRVILGGIHTNGKANASRDIVKKWPFSSRWVSSQKSKKLQKSPIMFIEEHEDKLKEFSESKRLFYVACTRAEKSLVWVNLNTSEKELKHTDNSWIQGIRKSSQLIEPLTTNKHIAMNMMADVESDDESNEDNNGEGELPVPLFHLDQCGLTGFDDHLPSLSILSDLSVTRLASVAQCPRKFYLQNVCKIDPEFQDKDQIDENEAEIFDEEEVIKIRPSSAERGTHIHAIASKWILGEEIKNLKTDEKEILVWLDKVLPPESEYVRISEKGVKFAIHGFMISGTPDLLLIDRNSQKAEVWDFKTGKRKVNNEDHYWTQITLYAFYLQSVLGISDIKLKLAYVDEKALVEKSLSSTEINEKVDQTWRLISKGDQINREHCSSCSFGNLCRQH